MKITIIAALAAFAAAIPLQPAAPGAESLPVALHLEDSTAASVLPNAYIGVFRRDAVADAVEAFVARFERLAILGNFRTYTIGSRRFFSGSFRDETVRQLRVEGGDVIDVLERDQEWETKAFETQMDPSWALDRLDQRDLPLDNMFRYDSKAGEGVSIFVVDTGINDVHTDFGSRVTLGFNAVGREGPEDQQGHGTHCAGSAAGTKYGVAKKASLVSVKTMNRFGSGSGQNILDGMQYISDTAVPGAAVASMSLGTGAPADVIDVAADELVRAGIVVVAAAGNSDADGCTSSPARAELSIGVGATDFNDTRSVFSNWGSCVDIFAPGSDIEGPWIGGPNEIITISGTSMAAPHVSGAIALILAQNPGATPAQAREILEKNATPNKVADPKGSTNLLLYTPFDL